MSLPVESKVYREGRCRSCGWRVTVEHGDDFHMRCGRRCGPVETEHPFEVPDEPPRLDTGAPFAAPDPVTRARQPGTGVPSTG